MLVHPVFCQVIKPNNLPVLIHNGILLDAESDIVRVKYPTQEQLPHVGVVNP